jgi:hypothetical protein
VEEVEDDEARRYHPLPPSLDGEDQAGRSLSLAAKPKDPESWSAAVAELQIHKHGKG